MLKLSMLIPKNLKDNIELGICDGETAKQAHKELFHFSDNAYIVADEKANIFYLLSDIINACDSSSDSSQKIHLVVSWINLVRFSLWQASKPTTGDVFTLLRNSGVSSGELQPLKSSDIDDIFPWLYYGKRFDVLRKICHMAKRKVESNFKKYTIAVECHVIAEDTKKIVASSL